MNARPTNCPDCGEDLRPNAKGCACGWRFTPPAPAPGTASAHGTAPAGHDPYCAFERDGVRVCTRPGSVTTPRGKRWYCAEHCPQLPRYHEGRAVPPPMGFDGLRRALGDVASRMPSRPSNPEADADRVAT